MRTLLFNQLMISLFASILFSPLMALDQDTQGFGTFTDSRDSHVYKWVKIGKQTWMAENLAIMTKKGSFPQNNDESYVAIYGRLYDWETARIVCPQGWHLPYVIDWETLIDFVDGEQIGGNRLKSITGWKGKDYNYGGNSNSSGFSGLPGGRYVEETGIIEVGERGFWWSATELTSSKAATSLLFDIISDCGINEAFKHVKLSVRCIRD